MPHMQGYDTAPVYRRTDVRVQAMTWTIEKDRYVKNVGVDADGHCIVCGYAVEWIAETVQPHECPPGFTKGPLEPPKEK